MSGAISGNSTMIAVAPGTDLYFRKKATGSAFRSAVQHLVVPVRPVAPAYSIDFINESTAETLPSEHEYAYSSDFTGALNGTGDALILAPNADYYFRVKYTATSFVSEAFHLQAPVRPVINSDIGDTLQDDYFTATVGFPAEADGFDASDLEVSNANVILTDPLTLKITPVSPGEVTLMVNANAITGGNFASDRLITYYKEVISSIPDAVDLKEFLSVYPVPFRDILMVETLKRTILPADILLTDIHGAVVLSVKMVSSRITLGVSEIPRGMYIIRTIDSAGNVAAGKVIKQ
jgi:hypothetical protein